ESMAVGHQIQLEDVGICEEVQRGLGSRSYSTGRFSVKREGAGYHFHQLLAGRLREAAGARWSRCPPERPLPPLRHTPPPPRPPPRRRVAGCSSPASPRPPSA